jgi:hypothetical protein
MFGPLKEAMRGKFCSNDEVQQAMHEWLNRQTFFIEESIYFVNARGPVLN